MLYWLFPRLWNTKLHSVKLANWHFWIALLGMMFYVVPMYASGITQGLMWKQFTPEGFLQYPNFLETVLQIVPLYKLRAIGGSLYLVGAFLMTYNLWRTARGGQVRAGHRSAGGGADQSSARRRPTSLQTSLAGSANPSRCTVLALVAVAIGGLVEIVPLFLIKSNVPTITSVKPYTPLEMMGRDIYIREGCVGCHSQMIRPFRSETERYGDYSKAGEFVYDHPFLWGSEAHRAGFASRRRQVSRCVALQPHG